METLEAYLITRTARIAAAATGAGLESRLDFLKAQQAIAPGARAIGRVHSG
jgi:hypothetical protein